MNAPPLAESELAEAFDRVERNEGCAGVDGITVERFAARTPQVYAGLRDEVVAGTYRALPLLRILVEKAPGSSSSRALLVPAVRDRVLQTAIARRLSRGFEEEFLESSYAYRAGRGVDRAVARIRVLRDLGYWHIVDADIRRFFDSVDFAVLESQLAAAGEPEWILALVSQWIRAPAWDGTRLRARGKGLPQGSPISPLLANFYLTRVDAALASLDAKLVRYADDLVVLAHTETAARQALERLAAELAAVRLELHPDKTRLTSFDLGLRFLGVYFQKDEIWTPWKDRPKDRGRVLHAARPMPRAALERYLGTAPRGEFESRLASAGARYLPGSRSKKGETPVTFLYLTEQGSVLRKSGDRLWSRSTTASSSTCPITSWNMFSYSATSR